MYFSNISSPIATETIYCTQHNCIDVFHLSIWDACFSTTVLQFGTFPKKAIMCNQFAKKQQKRHFFLSSINFTHTHTHFWCFQPTAFPNISGETSRRKSTNGSALLFSLKSCLLKNKTSFVSLKSNIQFRT